MKVTIDNINKIDYFGGIGHDYNESFKSILSALLIDIAELNNQIDENKYVYIDYEDEHAQYSPERTDPCPDYYGYFTLRFENNPYEKIGDYMDLDMLDTVICSLINFVEYQ